MSPSKIRAYLQTRQDRRKREGALGQGGRGGGGPAARTAKNNAGPARLTAYPQGPTTLFSLKIRSQQLLLVTALVTPVLACGPFFPATIIDNPRALLAAPFVRFTASLAKIPGPFTTFHAVSAPEKVSLSEHSLAAELADLAQAGVAPETITSHRLRRLALVEFGPQSPGHPLPPSLADTTGLPPEFALYYLTAFHLGQGEPTIAAEKLARLLALPAAERHYKSTWAAYGLGRMAQEHYPAVARYYFQQTRELAHAGFADPLGLAAESLGWEAKTYFDANDLAAAALLYLDQFATGDSSAPNSLRFVAARLLAHGTPEQFAAFAAHPRLREIQIGRAHV